jgi:uncharacterized protein DUF4402
MTKFLRMTSLAAAAAMTIVATPSLAVGPNQNSTATARVVKPLTLTWVRDLDLGTIVLSGAGVWSGANVGISRAGVFSCVNANTTCSGATQTAQYTITGTNNQVVTINSPNVTLTNQNDGVSTLLMTVDNPGTVNLTNSGNSGLTFDLGGQITVASSTPDGTYSGTLNVTVNY